MASKKSEYTPNDFNQLAYEFAIRNPRVIELLGLSLDQSIAEELSSYGIYSKSIDFRDGQEIEILSLRELYLDYEHLTHIVHHPFSPYGEGTVEDPNTLEKINEYRGDKFLVHPNSKKPFFRKENELEAYRRINQLIESRGGKLQRLMDGTTFKHYDAIKIMGQTVYSLDPTRSSKKTIKSDISFVSEWIKPEKYLQLIPQYRSVLASL
ncbi:hypothetical protein [Hydrogenimonas cancrithermarum]|nr:hypothetical protein [Hydrogenimonas cancrithermarum]